MRILHFSDVHLSKDKKAAVEMLRDRMIEKLVSINASSPNKIDLVVFTGDFLDKSGIDNDGNSFGNLREGLDLFDRIFITPLLSALHLPKDRFIMTMGNHEVVRNIVPQEDVDILHDRNREHLLEDFYWRIISRDNVAWLEDYNSFEQEFYKKSINEQHNYEQNKLESFHSINIDGQIVNIMSVSTVWSSCTEDEHVYIDIEQINAFKRKVRSTPNAINILVGHNNYDDIIDKNQQEIILNALTDFVNLSFSGHTHHGVERRIENEHGNTYFNVAPGLNRKNIGTPNTNYRNGFMIVDYCLSDGWMANSWYEENDDSNFVEKQNYGINGTSRRRLPHKKHFVPIIDFLNEYPKGEYIQNEKTREIQNKLANGTQFIRFSALPGFGKTKLLYETFVEKKSDLDYISKVFYCKSGLKCDTIYDEFRSIVNTANGNISILIIDDCPNDLLQRCSEHIHNVKSNIRLIAVGNQPYDSFILPNCENIELYATDLKTEVDDFISKKVVIKSAESNIINEIQTLADGFPYMAILLVNAYNENMAYGLNNIKFLVDKLLQHSQERDGQFKAMRTLALFQPMPTENQNYKAYNFVINNELITHITDMNIYERRGLFSKTITKYSNTLVENTGDWINVRPFPLAVCLVAQWFEEMSADDLEKLFNEIQDQPQDVFTVLKEGFGQRISMMQESNAAKEIIDKIVCVPNGSFCNEKVVCSEMGSRLFLAMATVNPEKVAKCLLYIFNDKSTDWIRDHITNDIRRNLVYTLNKLCFANESYDDAVLVLAQFAEAENEHWANNSKNGLTQLFPILLPDTEVNLEKRAKTIENLWNMGYRDFAIGAINFAFKNGNFTRMGGAEKFGWHHRESYKPQTWDEVFKYWRRCKALLLFWIEKDKSIINGVRDIVERHVHDWRSTNLMNEYLFPFIDTIAPKSNWQWNKMYELLIQLLRFHESEYTQEQKTKINEYIEKLKPTSFADTLVYAGRKIFDNDSAKQSYEDIAHELMQPLAVRFIQDKIYDNIDEVRALTTMQSGDSFFIIELKTLLSDNELTIFFNNVKQIVNNKKDDFSSNFVNGILRAFCQFRSVQQYITYLFDNGLKMTYSRAMAVIENDKMDSYHQLLSLYSNKLINYEQIVAYMSSLWGLTNVQMQILLPSLIEQFPDKKTDILAFVIKHKYWTKILDDKLHLYVRKLLLECPLADEQNRSNYEHLEVIKEYLKKYKNTDLGFGVKINKKIIETLSKKVIHGDDLSGLYSELLQDPYQSAILDDFMNALANDISFYMQVQYEIGSGFSFGVGPLFQYVPIEKLQKYCEENVKIRHILANMAPVFISKENNPRAEFSDFIKWIIDKYGDDEQQSGVLSGISANMGTMSWTGTPIPLYEDMINILSLYLNHRYLAVQEWAKREIDQLTQSIAQEKSRDDFMRMHYS